MKIYAILNENNICVGISQLSSEKNEPNLIEIPVFDGSYVWKKYENGVWSTITYEPQSTAPIDEFTEVQNQVSSLQTITTLTSSDFQGFIDWYFTTHPDEA